MLAPWKKNYNKPRQHIKKQRHYFAYKVGNPTLISPSNLSYGFSSSHVWMWELDRKEGWMLKNWCFWTMVMRKLLRVPWTSKKSNQSNLKDINPEYLLEGMMLNLQYFSQLMRRDDSSEKTLMLGKTESKRKRGGRGWDVSMALPTPGTWVWASSGDGEGQGSLVCCRPWGHKESDMT